MKKIIIALSLLCIVSISQSFAQVKVVTGGNVVISRPLDPSAWVLVGETENNINTLTNIGKFNIKTYYKSGLTIEHTDNSNGIYTLWPWAETSHSNIIHAGHWIANYGNRNNAFFTSEGAVYGKVFLSTSDGALKNNIQNITDALTKILALRGVTYKFKPEAYCGDSFTADDITYANNEPKHYGFISQEVASVIPEIVKDVQTPNTVKALNYIEIIPLLVEGIKAQQLIITQLQDQINSCCNKPAGIQMNNNIQIDTSNNKLQKTNFGTTGDGINMNKSNITLGAKRYQNNPNPFTENTSIDFEIPLSTTKAALYIYNLQGEQIKSIPINARGKSNIILSGNDLKAGSYFYTLIVDNSEIDTKKMILTQ
jgi:hypothetical protein